MLGMGMTSIWTVVNLGVEGRDGEGGGGCSKLETFLLNSLMYDPI